MTDQIQDQDVVLDENEIEEAHDPKNAEEASIASVKAAEGKSPKAKKRKGDKSNSAKAEKMDKVVATEAADLQVDFHDELNSLVESEATLSGEFKAKATIIFEANVKAKLAEEVDRLEESYATQLDEEVSATKAELVEKVDSYLNYVVEAWVEENQLAIQSGLRAEIAEDFMTGLKTLFTESYVDIPEAKVDLVDDLAESVDTLSAKLNEATEQLLASKAEVAHHLREAAIREASSDLADTQVDKLRTMVEGYDFDNEFANKVATIKESVFAKKATTSEELIEDDTTTQVELSESMQRYVAAIKSTQ
jgi:hypothetical protein|tara:strand:+ start:164 stop:1084 length:921 start_codon:yes stop_codon:yes gene_type:complete